MNLQPIDEYKKALRDFDWFYDYSDDHRVWVAGEAGRKELMRQAGLSQEHRQAFDEAVALINASTANPTTTT